MTSGSKGIVSSGSLGSICSRSRQNNTKARNFSITCPADSFSFWPTTIFEGSGWRRCSLFKSKLYLPLIAGVAGALAPAEDAAAACRWADHLRRRADIAPLGRDDGGDAPRRQPNCRVTASGRNL